MVKKLLFVIAGLLSFTVNAQTTNTNQYCYPMVSIAYSYGVASNNTNNLSTEHRNLLSTSVGNVMIGEFQLEIFPFRNWGFAASIGPVVGGDDDTMHPTSIGDFMLEQGYIFSDGYPISFMSDCTSFSIGAVFRKAYKRFTFRTSLSVGGLSYGSSSYSLLAKEDMSNDIRKLTLNMNASSIFSVNPRIGASYILSKRFSLNAAVGLMCPLRKIYVDSDLTDAYTDIVIDHKSIGNRINPYFTAELGIAINFGYNKYKK